MYLGSTLISMKELSFSLKNPNVDVWQGAIYVFDGHMKCKQKVLSSQFSHQFSQVSAH